MTRTSEPLQKRFGSRTESAVRNDVPQMGEKDFRNQSRVRKVAKNGHFVSTPRRMQYILLNELSSYISATIT